eukprot:gene7227-biopygen3026
MTGGMCEDLSPAWPCRHGWHGLGRSNSSDRPELAGSCPFLADPADLAALGRSGGLAGSPLDCAAAAPGDLADSWQENFAPS